LTFRRDGSNPFELPVVTLDEKDYRSLSMGEIVRVDATGNPETLLTDTDQIKEKSMDASIAGRASCAETPWSDEREFDLEIAYRSGCPQRSGCQPRFPSRRGRYSPC
jgi:hypothetical protein